MYDAGKVIPGLAIFLVVVTLPLWWNPALGRSSTQPEVELPKDGSQCVLTGLEMREGHMQILDRWRTEVVRDGQRFYTGRDGVVHEKSLTGTCLGCHTNKAQFCDKCHEWAAVKPYCFDCHVVPEVK